MSFLPLDGETLESHLIQTASCCTSRLDARLDISKDLGPGMATVSTPGPLPLRLVTTVPVDLFRAFQVPGKPSVESTLWK